MLQVVSSNRLVRSDLQDFTKRVADLFNSGQIRAPVHLSGGNEDQLINIFTKVKPNDWVLSTWRSHYHCLLKGVPQKRLLADICEGRSISLCYPDYKILSSAIVAGNLPIAVGIAWAIKRSRSADQVWVFSGDMAATTGMFSECVRYSFNHVLPINFVVEDNGKSVCTDTVAVWGGSLSKCQYPAMVHRYAYLLPWPHSGAGKRVNF